MISPIAVSSSMLAVREDRVWLMASGAFRGPETWDWSPQLPAGVWKPHEELS